MKVLGIDPGSKVLGLSYMDETKLLRAEQIDVHLENYESQPAAIIEHLKNGWIPGTEVLAIEQLVKIKGRPADALGFTFRAIVKWAKEWAKIPVVKYHPSTWRSRMLGSWAVGMKGDQVKAEAIKYVRQLYPLLPADLSDHVAESIIIARCHIQTVRMEGK